MSPRKPLEPLIPLEQFKKLVSAIARVPKEAADKKPAAAKETQPPTERKPKR